MQGGIDQANQATQRKAPMQPDQDEQRIRRLVLLGMGGFFAVALLVLIAMLLAYPDTATAPSASPTAPREIEVALSEFAYDPANIDVAAGETVRFVVTNTGTVQHELRLTTQAAVDAHLADAHAGHGSAHEEPGLVVVEPGETKSLEWTFTSDPDGPTVVACLIPGHYEAGMHGELHVTP